MFVKSFLLLVVAVVKVISVQSCEEDIAFIKFGTYRETHEVKTYYIPRYFKAHWVHTRSICKAYGMDVVSLETLAEADAFFGLCQANAGYFEVWTHIGGITLAGKSLSTWYWVNSGKRIDYRMKFGFAQPDNAGNAEYCLSIGKEPNNNFHFNDINCYGHYELKFVCQKIKYNIETLERISNKN